MSDNNLAMPPEARPRAFNEIRTLTNCPEIADRARSRGVSHIVHFTTTMKAVGILTSSAILCRQRLPDEAHLRYVYEPNAIYRHRDAAWLGYANLSVSRVNVWMLNYSRRWHPGKDVSWVIFAFLPEILQDPGVVFATTNNAYPECRRWEGLFGFEQLFADTVLGYRGIVQTRGRLPSSDPTDRQAEVLYPEALALTHLEGIYAEDEQGLDNIQGTLGAFGLNIRATLAPEMFR